MRSMASSGRLSSDGVPTVAEPMRTPSSKSRVCRASSPRMKIEAVLPRPPLLEACRPACCVNSSTRVRPSARSMAARSSTVMSASTCLAASGVRVAVTVTYCWAWAWAWAGPVSNKPQQASTVDTAVARREKWQRAANRLARARERKTGDWDK